MPGNMVFSVVLKPSDALTTREDILPKSKSKWLSAAAEVWPRKINDGSGVCRSWSIPDLTGKGRVRENKRD
jgi:hypothetical protein